MALSPVDRLPVLAGDTPNRSNSTRSRKSRRFDDLKKFEPFQDEWLRGGPVRRWVPKAVRRQADLRVRDRRHDRHSQEPRSRIEDFRIDYELFSQTLPDEYFPPGSNWLMLGPSGPRRLRLAVEHLAQYRGGICFCIDLDPRWVIKLIKKGWMEHLEAYKQHCIDQAITILGAGHDIRCMFTTPKLLEALARRWRSAAARFARRASRASFPAAPSSRRSGPASPCEEFLEGVYMTPTYGNTLMGLACSKPVTAAEDGYKITYYAPQPRAVIEVVDFDDYDRVVDYGQTGRVKLTTLTKEFFVPGFLERDEGEREQPYVKYPWDGVSGVRPVPRIGRSHDRRRVLTAEGEFDEISPAIRQITRCRRRLRRRLMMGRKPMPIRSGPNKWLFHAITETSATDRLLQGGALLHAGVSTVLNIPILRWGKPYESLEVDQVVHFITGEPIAKVSQANGGLLERDMRKAQPGPRRAARDSLRRTDRAGEEGGRAVSQRHAAAGRRQAIARRIRPPAIGHDRPARAHVQGQHAEELLRALAHGRRCSTR